MHPPRTIHLYLDDSGTRRPDKAGGAEPGSWFALGGLLIDDEHRDIVRAEYDAFRARWSAQLGDAPLHSNEIRQSKGAFRWLHGAALRGEFLGDLQEMLLRAPILVTACVVSRPGYTTRYAARYGEKRWWLCKTAFTIVVERAAKFAQTRDARLRVHVERTDADVDRRIADYFAAMREGGMPFDEGSSDKYAPLGANALRDTLLELRFKGKDSRLMQLADLCLYPLCRRGEYPTYLRFVEQGKLVDSALALEQQSTLGIKYSCFDPIAP